MKKRISVKLSIIVCLLLLSSCNSNVENNTIEEQLLEEMKEAHMEVEEIIHLEVVNDGMLVFYTKDNNLYDGFIKLKGAKWKWHLGGGALPLQTEDGINWSFTNFDDFFVRYGVITDNNIKQVKDGESEYAKIIQTKDGLRIYFFLNKTVVFDSEKKRTEFNEIVPVYEN
ncbi:hypothetical protein [Psychrobacillus sp. NPDC096389]|uniref:hypothetical protein n=1 Tax=Psychrobacillus sp. NPDC096389 TaxID=3364490 RepID=UPI0038106365